MHQRSPRPFLMSVVLLLGALGSAAGEERPSASAQSELFRAAAKGDLAALRSQLDAGQDLNARDAAGRTALMEAAEHGRLEAARLLVDAGADLNAAQRGWGTALEIAERLGHEKLAALLLQAGARTSGRSVGDTVCVRPWAGEGYCGLVEVSRKTSVRIRITELVGCANGCEARAECSAGQVVGGVKGLRPGDAITTVSWCLTHTGVQR